MLVYALAIGAALLFGVGSVVQQRAAMQAPPGSALQLRLLWWLVRQRLWLLGVGTALVGNGLSGAALGMSSVALVQPLLVTRLLFALPLAAVWMRRSVPRRDWLGALATAAGLGIFILAGRPSEGQVDAPPLWRWALTAGLIGAITLTLVLIARRLGPEQEAPMLGAGAGMLFGLQAGLTHTAVSRLASDGVLSLLMSWTAYAVAVTAVLGTLLAQSAYGMAPLTASYPTLAAVEPLAGIGIGVGVLGGGLNFGPRSLAIEAGGLVVMTAGIYLLARSPLVTGQHDVIERRAEEGRAYRTEQEVERDLVRLRRDLARSEGTAGRLHRRPADRLEADLRQVDADVARLRELEKDIQRHRQAEHHRVEPTSEAQRAELARHERILDDWEQEIEQKSQSLCAEAEELRQRAQLARSDPGNRHEDGRQGPGPGAS